MDIHFPEDRLRTSRLVRKHSLATGRTQHVLRSPCSSKDGTVSQSDERALIRDAQAGPRPSSAVAGLVDITALKQAEAELRESEQRFRLMAETIQDVFWIATPDIRPDDVCEPGLRAGLGPELSGAVSASPTLIWRASIRRIGSGL